MESDLILLIALGCALIAVFIAGIRNLEVSLKRAQFAQGLFTLAAILVTAYWFFLERKGTAHADVSQSVEVVPIGKGIVAVEAHIAVENLGRRLLTIDRINSRLQLARYDTYHYDELSVAVDDEQYWTAKREDDEEQFARAELRWPIERKYDRAVDYRIEPGETDLIVVTFLLQCAKANWVRVASDVYNPTMSAAQKMPGGGPKIEGNDGFFWKTRSFADIRQACGKAS